MAEENHEVENFENEGGAVQPPEQVDSGQGGAGAGTPAPPSPVGVSPEEFKRLQAEHQQLVSWVRENFFAEPEPEEPEDLATYVKQYVDQRFGAVQPYIASQMQQEGDKKFNDLIDTFEKQNPGEPKVNRKLAYAMAEQMVQDAGGDPLKAVELGYQQALEIIKEERKAGASEFRKPFMRGHDSEFEMAGGTPGAKDRKTYDEVIDHWASQSEL